MYTRMILNHNIFTHQNKKEDTDWMAVEFMTADTSLPPSIPLPEAVIRLPVSSTAKIMYARMLDAVMTDGVEDVNGILFICFPIMELSEVLSKSHMTVRRSLNRLSES